MALHLFNIPKQFSLTQNVPRHPLHGTCLKQRIKCLAGNQDLSQTIERRSANYQPAAWSYDLLESLKKDNREEIFDGGVKTLEKMYEDRAKKLEEEVKCRMYDDNIEPLALLELVDDIQNLGLGYRFEKDIKRSLKRRILEVSNVTFEKSLHAAALSFRILRQHGYEVSQGNL
ncbi:hypothetical protein AAG906_040024 [Vitis piasezkii]